MRNIRARRRFKALLILLLAVSMVAFFESRIEAFAPQFKALAETRIEDAFGKKIDISIGAIDGGIVRPFALSDVKVLGSGGKIPSQVVEINSLVSNYRIWDFIFSKVLSRPPHVAIDFETKNKEVSGFLKIKGGIENASIKGYISLFGGDRIEIKGKLKNGMARMIMSPKEGLVKVEANFAADGVMLINIAVHHLKVRTFDIDGEAVIKNIAVKNTANAKDSSFEGEIETKNLILNYKPFLNVRASYRISKEALEVSNLDLGKIFYINGKFGLREPYLIDATAVTDNVNLSQMLSIVNPRYASFLTGTMNSKWEFKGAVNNLKSKVHIEIKKGYISGMSFDYLSADLKGDGPMVKIEDSRITRPSGSLVLAGEMDMRRIGKDSLFENLKIAEGEKAIMWDAYDTAKWQDVREFRMKKKVIGDLNVGFKQFVNDDKVDESLRERDQYELEYSLHPTDSIKVRFGDNKSFFGLEHKDKF
jgi:hypothetical protein